MAATVVLEGRALELATQMVSEGSCATLEEAVARSLALAHLHDTAPAWDTLSGGERADIGALAEAIEREADAGSLGENAPELWRRVRTELRSLAARQAP